MKKIKVHKWVTKGVDGKDMPSSGIVVVEQILMLDIPKPSPFGMGHSKYHGFKDTENIFLISNALREAKEKDSDFVYLETSPYNYLKDRLEKDTPGYFGHDPEAYQAIVLFRDKAEEYTPDLPTKDEDKEPKKEAGSPIIKKDKK